MQLRDAKEREVRFKTKLAVLDKLVAELKANISEKEEKIAQVEGQLVQQVQSLILRGVRHGGSMG
jgi:predicted  nucleic acid-binding Zn-ribbon protein